MPGNDSAKRAISSAAFSIAPKTSTKLSTVWRSFSGRLLLRRQKHNDPVAAEDQVGGGLLCRIALARDHPAVHHRPAVVLRVPEAELAELGVVCQRRELLVEHRSEEHTSELQSL